LPAAALLQVGDKVRAVLTNVDRDKYRMNISTKNLEKQPGDFLRLGCSKFYEQARQLKTADTKYKAGDVVNGVVTAVQQYSAFVEFGVYGKGKKGLLHISQITHERLITVEQIFEVWSIHYTYTHKYFYIHIHRWSSHETATTSRSFLQLSQRIGFAM
jgi:ribosomal protein S1